MCALFFTAASSSTPKHPAVLYLEEMDKIRKRKRKEWEKNQRKQRKKHKANKLIKAARRRKTAKLEKEDETVISDDDPLDHIDYDNLHLAYDQEKDHKFSF